MKQYPHYIHLSASPEATQDGNGNWVAASEPVSSFVSICRDEPNGSGAEIQVAGGTYHKFSSLIQLPKCAQSIAVGSTVSVSSDKEGTDVRITSTVLRFDKGQLHSRLWL